jgi:Ser/Thr protein kinase RdoA (MazF antagonist)
LSNTGEDPGVIDFQIQALTHIKNQDPALPEPRVLQTRKGTLSDLVKCSENAEHIEHVLTYLPGIGTGDA